MVMNAMRSGASSPIAKALFSLLLFGAVAGLGLMDYNGMLRTNFHGTDVASVAGQTISAPEFDSEVRNVLSQQQHGENEKQAYADGTALKILDADIDNRVMRRSAFDLGLQVDDGSIAIWINKQLKDKLLPGEKPSDGLKRILTEQGMSEAALIASAREGLANDVLRGAVQTGIDFVPDAEAADLWRFGHETRQISYIFLPDSATTGYKQPTDAVLLPFYQAGKEHYSIPESRAISYAILKPGKVDDTVNDEALHRAYDDEKAKFTSPERRKMAQAIFSDQAAAKVAADKVRAGTDLKTFGSSYIGEQDFEQTGLDPAIAAPAFTAKAGDVIGPIHTELGWHVLKVKAVLSPQQKSFESVRDQLRQDVVKHRASDALYTESSKIDDAINGGATLEEAAKDNGLTIVKVTGVRADGSSAAGGQALKDFPDNRPAMIKAAFQTDEGETAPALALKDGSYVFIRTDQITAKSYKPFADVKSDLSKSWIADQQDVLNGDAAKAAENELETKQTTLDKIAAAHNVKVTKADIGRINASQPSWTPTTVQAFFDVTPGSAVVAPAKDGFIIGVVNSAKMPDPPKTIAEIKAREGQALAGEYLLAYTSYLRDKYGVKIHEDALARLYGPNADAQQ